MVPLRSFRSRGGGRRSGRSRTRTVTAIHRARHRSDGAGRRGGCGPWRRGGCRRCSLESRGHLGRDIDTGQIVERGEYRHLVAVQVMEADVDAAVGGHQIPVPHAGGQQAVDPVTPVVDQPVRVDAGAAQPIRVRHHRDRRLDHRDGIAMGEGDGGIGKVVISGVSCSACCGDFSTQVRGPRRKVSACRIFFR